MSKILIYIEKQETPDFDENGVQTSGAIIENIEIESELTGKELIEEIRLISIPHKVLNWAMFPEDFMYP